jgi:hypothetical protein
MEFTFSMENLEKLAKASADMPRKDKVATLMDYDIPEALAKKIAALPFDVISEFLRKDQAQLKDVISYNSIEVQKATAEVKANEAYVKAALVVKDFNAALRETVTPMKAALELSTFLLKCRQE